MFNSKNAEKLLTNNKNTPLACYELNNGSFVVGVYKGKLSELDIVIKYRKKVNGKWTRRRQPNHLHWVIDLIVKKSHQKRASKKFLELLIKLWDNIPRVNTIQEREIFLEHVEDGIPLLPANLNEYGDFNVEELYLILKLLAFQEKINREDAHVFKDILTALKKRNDIHSVVAKTNFKRR